MIKIKITLGLGLIFTACIVFIIHVCAVYVTKTMDFIDSPCRQSYLYVIQVVFCQLVQ